MLLKPKSDDPVALRPHLSSIAAAEAVNAITEVDVRVRWPNDLYASGRKLGGILCEGSFRGAEAEAFVIGIGINVNQTPDTFPADVRERATGLSEYTLDEHDVAAHIVARLETWWQTKEPARILARFRELAEGASDRAVEVQPRDGDPFTARTRGIADDGGLIVELDDGEERILYSEDVIQLRNGDERS